MHKIFQKERKQVFHNKTNKKKSFTKKTSKPKKNGVPQKNQQKTYSTKKTNKQTKLKKQENIKYFFSKTKSFKIKDKDYISMYVMTMKLIWMHNETECIS